MRQRRDVMDVLRWSYDILQRAEQRMFVHITCMFINESVEEALLFWRSCKDCVSCGGMGTPHTSLQNLIDRNLVSVGGYGSRILKVHDLLVELGKEIGKLGGTHLVKGNIREAAFSKMEGSTNTMAMNLRESRKRKFDVEEFANMSNLHFLELPEGSIMDGDWRCMPIELRWLRWRNTSLTHVPPDLDLSHLVSLDFSKSSTLVALWSKSNCSLKGCPNLVQLNLSECTSITKLPESIGQSLGLQDLNLRGCTRLKKLPESVGQLKQLQDLNLNKCKRLKALLDSIGQASQLQRLDLSECMKLDRLPESMGLLKGVEWIALSSCASLKTLPYSIGDMSSLECLHTRHCTSLTTLPLSIQFCSRLHRLALEGSTDCEIFSASSVGEAWTELASLYLKNSHGLASLLDYGALKSLEALDVNDKTLTKFPESIGLLVTLAHLNIECERLQCLPNSLGDLKSLRCLYLERCENLKRLPKTLGALTNLEDLSIKDCRLLKKLPSSIGLLSGLHYFEICRCKKMQKLPTSFTQLKTLYTFSLIGCGSTVAIRALTTLQGMPIWGSTSLTQLPPSLEVLSNLHIEWPNSYLMYTIPRYKIGKSFDGTCQVLEEDEGGFLKAYHDETTGLLSLLRCVYCENKCEQEFADLAALDYLLHLRCRSS